MPTQVQTLIEPVYEAVVEVPADAEVITEASLINTAVALGNRIEFLKQLQSDTTDEPERFFIVRDDFGCALYDGALSVVYSDHLWRTADVGSPTITSVANSAKNPGLFRVTCATSDEFYMGLNDAASHPFGMITTQLLSMVLKVSDDAGNLASNMTIGLKKDYSLSNGGTDSLLLFYSVASPNWQLIVRKASVQVTHDLGVAVDYNKFITCKFVKNGNGYDVYIDGVMVHAVLQADKPTGELNFGLSVLSSVADLQPVRLFLDLVYARTKGAGNNPRSGI